MQTVRGFRDIYGHSYDLMAHIVQTAQTIMKKYGFEGMELPIVEYTNVFQRSLGDTSDVVHKEMYSFLDRNEESLTLRPEGTASLMRALISNKMTQELPQKFYYQGPMFRYDRPQKGRYRQFYQFGVECVGIDHPYADYEVIQSATDILKALGIDGYTLHLNTLGDQESRTAFNLDFQNFLQNYKNDLSQDSQMRLLKNPLRILDSKDAGDQKIIAQGPKLKDYLTPNAKRFFNQVCDYLSTADIPFLQDDHLVRGLDYYCHTSFEFKHEGLGAQAAFGGGGRYDGLISLMGGPDISGIGWAFGVDRLMLLLEDKDFKDVPPVIIIPFEEGQIPYALSVAHQLRTADIKCEISFKGKLPKDFKYAQRRVATYTVLIGSEEVAENFVTLKHMDSQSENKRLSINDLILVV